MGMREGEGEEGERGGERRWRERRRIGEGRGKEVCMHVCVSSSSCMIMGIMKTLKAKVQCLLSMCNTLSCTSTSQPKQSGSGSTRSTRYTNDHNCRYSFRTYWGKHHIVVEAGKISVYTYAMNILIYLED